MLTTNAVRALLDQVTYRPGWTITAHAYQRWTYLLIDGIVPDAYAQDDQTNIGVRAVVPPKLLNGSEFMDWLGQRLQKIEIHESREFFQWHCTPWDSPHKRQQAKHDYHVRQTHRNEPGDDSQPTCFWGVYKHDPDKENGLGELLGSYGTMPAALERARFEVIQDDLAKGMVIVNG